MSHKMKNQIFVRKSFIVVILICRIVKAAVRNGTERAATTVGFANRDKDILALHPICDMTLLFTVSPRWSVFTSFYV